MKNFYTELNTYRSESLNNKLEQKVKNLKQAEENHKRVLLQYMYEICSSTYWLKWYTSWRRALTN
jgi:hypothetical protein